MLGLVENETAFHEGLGDRVELSLDGRVRTTTRKRDHAVPVLRCEAVGALPHPVLTVGLGQSIDVEHRLPGGLVFDELRQKRTPPDTTDVVRVLPEVVDPGAADRRGRDAVPRVVHFEELRVNLAKLGDGLEHRGVRLRAFLRPRERFLAFHLLQPEVWIFVRGDTEARGQQTHEDRD